MPITDDPELAAALDAMPAELRASFRKVLGRASDDEQARRALPCYPHADDEAGAAACETVSAWHTCRWASAPTPKDRDGRDADQAMREHLAGCPRARCIAACDAVRARLVAGGVPRREHDLVMAAAERRRPLEPYEPLQAVRARVAGRAWDGRGGDAGRADRYVRGSEALLVLAGSRGVGKTVAVCYAVARLGGRYLTAPRLARPGLDLDALVTQPGALVVDQLGREAPSSEWFASQFEDVLDRRYAERRLTVLCGNFTRAQFVGVYGEVMADRLRGDGALVELTGPSHRSQGELPVPPVPGGGE